MLHQRRAQPAVAAVRTAGGVRSALRRTRSRRSCGPGRSSGHPPRSRAQRAFVALPARVLGTRRACGARPRAARRRPRALRVACAWLWVPRSRERGHKPWHRSTALPIAPRARRGRGCDGPAFRHAGRCCGPTTAVERLALPTPTASRATRTQARSTILARLARSPVRGHASASSPKRPAAPLQPWGGPHMHVAVQKQRLSQATPQSDLHSGRWERGGRLCWDRSEPSTCMRSGLGCLRTGRHGGAGSSVRSRKCVLRIRVARISHPCGQSPGPASSAGLGAPFPSLPTGRARQALPARLLLRALVPPPPRAGTGRHGLFRFPRLPGTVARAARLPTSPSKLPGLCVVLIAGRQCGDRPGVGRIIKGRAPQASLIAAFPKWLGWARRRTLVTRTGAACGAHEPAALQVGNSGSCWGSLRSSLHALCAKSGAEDNQASLSRGLVPSPHRGRLLGGTSFSFLVSSRSSVGVSFSLSLHRACPNSCCFAVIYSFNEKDDNDDNDSDEPTKDLLQSFGLSGDHCMCS